MKSKNTQSYAPVKSIFAFTVLLLYCLPPTPASAEVLENGLTEKINESLGIPYPQRISVSDKPQIYQDCGDLESANIDRNSVVIMAVENSVEKQDTEFWVIKPDSDSVTRESKSKRQPKSFSVTCHFKRPISGTFPGTSVPGMDSKRINQLMADAVTPEFRKTVHPCAADYLNPYSPKPFSQQIEEYVKAENGKSTMPNEPEGLLNSILGAVGVEVFAGGAWATSTGDGTWRQEQFYPATIHSHSVDYGAGISIKPTPNDEIRLGYQHLLSFGIDALANASDYNVAACHTPGSNVSCWPTSHWHSKGGVNQVYLTYGRKFYVYGFPMIAEVGVNANQASYTVSVPDYNGGGPADGPASAPHPLEVKTKVKTRISGSIGIGTQPLPHALPGLTLMATAEFPVGATLGSGEDIPTGYYGFAVNLNARYRFCFLDGGNCKQ